MKLSRKLITKGVVTTMLTVAMVLETLPLPRLALSAYADMEKTITGLGTGAIVNPASPTETTSAWSGSYVYYGNYDESNDGTAEATKYRVLDKASTDFGVSGGSLLLDCDSSLYSTVFDADSKEWTGSDVNIGLNGDSYLTKNGNFTAVETVAIAASSKTSASQNDGSGDVRFSFSGLNGEKIFLLDVKEVTRSSYGYSDTRSAAENRAKKHTYPGNKVYPTYALLRSASVGDAIQSCRLVGDGSLYLEYCEYSAYVSPAFNVSLKSIVFSSLVSGTAGETGAEYKLTLSDSDLTIAVTDGSRVTRNGSTITVPYTITDNSDTSEADQVSVLITDSEWTAGAAATSGYTYLKLNVKGSVGTSGTGTFTLPDEYADKTCGTDYHVYILAEDVNSTYETDYASTPVQVTVPALPEITAQPSDLNLTYGHTTNDVLSVSVTAADGHTLAYQWYSNTSNSTAGGTAINGATAASYTVPADKNAGTTDYYYCVVTDVDALPTVTSNAAIVTINKADITAADITAPTAKTLEFNGSAQELINAGSVKNKIGTMQYALGDETKVAGTYSETIPTGTDAGTYHVWYKVVADSNHNDNYKEEKMLTVQIAEKKDETDDPNDQDPKPTPTETYTVMVTGGTGGGSYAAGATVTITAGAAPEGKEFDKWTTSDGVIFADASAASTIFTMPAKAVSVTATYRDIPDPLITPAPAAPVKEEVTINEKPVKIEAEVIYPQAVTWTGKKITKEQLGVLADDGMAAKVTISGLADAITNMKPNTDPAKLYSIAYDISGEDVGSGTFTIKIKLNNKALKKAKIKGDDRDALVALVYKLNEDLAKDVHTFKVAPIDLNGANESVNITIKATLKKKKVQVNEEDGTIKGLKSLTITYKVPAGKNKNGKPKYKTQKYTYKKNKVNGKFVINVTDATGKKVSITATADNQTFSGTRTDVSVKK